MKAYKWALTVECDLLGKSSVWEFTAGHLTQAGLDREGLSGEVLSKLGPEGGIVIVWQRKGEENARQHIQKSVVEGELGGFKELEKTQHGWTWRQ